MTIWVSTGVEENKTMAMSVRYTTINGEIIAENRSGTRRQYLPDPLGSTVALLDNTQSLTDTFTYWPYGEVENRTGTTATPFQFIGTWGYYQSETTVYVRARYLSVRLGRWITEDPLVFGDLPSPNSGIMSAYNYCNESPVTLVDPSGFDPKGKDILKKIDACMKKCKGEEGKNLIKCLAICLNGEIDDKLIDQACLLIWQKVEGTDSSFFCGDPCDTSLPNVKAQPARACFACANKSYGCCILHIKWKWYDPVANLKAVAECYAKWNEDHIKCTSDLGGESG